MSKLAAVLGSSPGGTVREKMRVAALRALRTLIQGVAAAIPVSGIGETVVNAAYWDTFLYSVIAAGATAIASFLNNIATIFPEDPTQKDPSAA